MITRQTGSTLLGLIAILLIFVVVQPLIPYNEQHFSEFGILGPNQDLGGYPSNIAAGQPILLYGHIGNHEGSAQFYQVFVKLGNQTTQVGNRTFASAPILFTYSLILDQNQSFTFPISFTVVHPGDNQRLIFELWNYNFTQQRFSYTGLWNQLFVNVTNA